MDRDEALTLVKSHVHKTNLLKHIPAAEAIMREVAECLNEDVGLWDSLIVSMTWIMMKHAANTSFIALEVLRCWLVKLMMSCYGQSKPHNYMCMGVTPESKMVLIAVDIVTSLIIALCGSYAREEAY